MKHLFGQTIITRHVYPTGPFKLSNPRSLKNTSFFISPKCCFTYIIIDELSMVSQVQIAWIDRRLRQAPGKTAEPLEGMSMIMTGDFRQLPPVGGRPLHTLDPKDQLNQEGFQAYRQFTEVCYEKGSLAFSLSTLRNMICAVIGCCGY